MNTNRATHVDPTHYIFPPRPQEAIPFSETKIFAELNWIAQLKYNGSRALIKYTPTGDTFKIELWNRHAERFRNYNAPDWLQDQLLDLAHALKLTGWTLLDGELLDAKHAAIKDTIAIWDVLVLNEQHLTGTTYLERYNELQARLTPNHASTPYLFTNPTGQYDLGHKLNDNLLMPRNYHASRDGTQGPTDAWEAIWNDLILKINAPYAPNSPLIEGLLFKNPLGKLEMGMRERNNSSWQARSRVTTGRHAF